MIRRVLGMVMVCVVSGAPTGGDGKHGNTAESQTKGFFGRMYDKASYFINNNILGITHSQKLIMLKLYIDTLRDLNIAKSNELALYKYNKNSKHYIK
jgi:hypothetical protein